jgi:hypothetical protein
MIIVTNNCEITFEFVNNYLRVSVDNAIGVADVNGLAVNLVKLREYVYHRIGTSEPTLLSVMTSVHRYLETLQKGYTKSRLCSF